MIAWRAGGDGETASHRVSIGGRVLDEETPRAGVTVTARRRSKDGEAVTSGREMVTDVRGLFWFEDLPSGKYAVEAAAVGTAGRERRSDSVEVQLTRERKTKSQRARNDAPVWLELVLLPYASPRRKGE